jgi:hypothetical protein
MVYVFTDSLFYELCSMLPVYCARWYLCIVFDATCMLCSMLHVSLSCLILIVRIVCLRSVCCVRCYLCIVLDTTCVLCSMLPVCCVRCYLCVVFDATYVLCSMRLVFCLCVVFVATCVSELFILDCSICLPSSCVLCSMLPVCCVRCCLCVVGSIEHNT